MHLLFPLAAIFSYGGNIHYRPRRDVVRASIPVIAIGNAVAGGAGKTPVTRALARLAKDMGFVVHIVGHGYGGKLKTPTRVNENHHDWSMVGDEALLLAQEFPTWIGRRHHTLLEAAKGADIVIMDDGFFDERIHKDWHILVVDGHDGWGNGKVIPAGPLRRPLHRALSKSQSVLLLGEDHHDIAKNCRPPLELWRATRTFTTSQTIKNKKIIAATAIGRPQRFFAMLEHHGARIIQSFTRPDHSSFSSQDVKNMMEQAKKNKALFAMTTKDWIKHHLPPKDDIVLCDTHIEWHHGHLIQQRIKQLC